MKNLKIVIGDTVKLSTNDIVSVNKINSISETTIYEGGYNKDFSDMIFLKTDIIEIIKKKH